MIPTIEERLQRHMDFWEGKDQKRPLCIVRLGKVFFSKEFEATKKIIEKGHIVTTDQIDVDSFLPDYERMYQELCQVDMDGIFSADPCTGFPWMEGAMGAQVQGSGVSFVSHKTLDDVEDLENLKFDPNNAWMQKYLEFVEKLEKLGNGRFSVGQPILRGVTDTIGSLIGQTELIYAVMEEPELMKRSFDTIVKAQRWLINEQYKRIKPFHGGYNFGFYHIWAPGKVIWYQEDLCALLSPSHYDEYLFETSSKYIEGYDYSLVHLHPTSFFCLDHMLKLKNLSVVQVNKDVGGPTVREMIPQFRKIIESGKKVAIGLARLNEDDIDAIFDCLPPHSVAVNLMADDIDDAHQIMDYVNEKSKKR